MGLFKFSISFCFSFGTLYDSRNLSISSRLPNLVAYNVHNILLLFVFLQYWLWSLLFHSWFYLFGSFLFSFFLNFFFNVYLFLRQRETEHEWGRVRERGRHRIRSRLQALSCQHRARRGALTHEPWDHDLSWSRMLNRLSHPDARSLQ